MSKGRERLAPRMTRGVFRLQLVMLTLITLGPIWQIASRWNEPWNELRYLMLAMLLICASFCAYLFYVRHYDGHFWDEEEARRQDWDRRGRQL